jgi:hypothetical protein
VSTSTLAARTLDWRELRALLARQRITHKALAAACDLSEPYVSRVLTGSTIPGRLGYLQLEHGLAAYGIALSEVAGHVA